nr:hypothetical protein [Bacteroides acidifaciens]
MIKNLRLPLFGVFLSVLAGSCTDNTFSDAGSIRTEGNARIPFSVTIPDAEIVQTRGGGTNDSSVERLNVLLFDNSMSSTNEADIKLVAHRSISDMTTNSVELPLSTDSRVVYVVANCGSGLADVPVVDKDLMAGDTYKYSLADIRAKLTTKLLGHPDSDSFVSGSDIPGLPVFMSGSLNFDHGMTSNVVIDVTLIRSVAKISVSTPLASSAFEIVGLTICNGEQTGGILPPPTGTSDTQGTARMGYTVNADSVLYAYPTYVSGTSNPPVSIVVEARFEGLATSSFYRLLLDTGLTDEKKGISLQRNHHYLVKINRVSMNGYKDLQTAIKSPANNIDYNVTDNNSFSNATLAGGYLFSMDFERMTVYADSVEQIMVATMQTNYPLTAAGDGSVTVDNGLVLLGGSSFKIGDEMKSFSVKVTSAYSHPEHSDTDPKGIHISLGAYNKTIEIIRKPSRDIHPSATEVTGVSDIKFISSSGDNSARWLHFSSFEKYTPFDVHMVMDKIQLQKNGYKAYVHLDENLRGTYREAFIETTSTENKRMRSYIRQEGTKSYTLGFFGGVLERTATVSQYSKQLLIEAYEENEGKLAIFLKDKIPTSDEQKKELYAVFENGRQSTMLLARTYESPAALYCLNKNRDTNGNGTIDDDEVLWYLPGIRQGMGIVLYQALSENLEENYWSSSCFINSFNHGSGGEATLRKVEGVWSLNTVKNSVGYSVKAQSFKDASNQTRFVRCVRDY